jgi:hypothetical protein
VVQATRIASGYMGGINPGTSTPPEVTLDPGQTGSAIVEGLDNPPSRETSCTYYPYLLVTPPNLTNSVRISLTALSTNIVGFPGCGLVQVHPIVPGTTGRTF